MARIMSTRATPSIGRTPEIRLTPKRTTPARSKATPTGSNLRRNAAGDSTSINAADTTARASPMFDHIRTESTTPERSIALRAFKDDWFNTFKQRAFVNRIKHFIGADSIRPSSTSIPNSSAISASSLDSVTAASDEGDRGKFVDVNFG